MMFIVMHDRDQKHVVMVDGINRFTTLLSLLERASRTYYLSLHTVVLKSLHLTFLEMVSLIWEKSVFLIFLGGIFLADTSAEDYPQGAFRSTHIFYIVLIQAKIWPFEDFDPEIRKM